MLEYKNGVLGITVIWSLQIQITSLTKLIMSHIYQILNINYQPTCMCVCVWLCLCKTHMQCISIHSLTPLISTYCRHHFGASRFLHSRKQCLLFIHVQAWTHTTQKWYQIIWEKTLFHEMYNNLLFIDDF